MDEAAPSRSHRHSWVRRGP